MIAHGNLRRISTAQQSVVIDKQLPLQTYCPNCAARPVIQYTGIVKMVASTNDTRPAYRIPMGSMASQAG